MKTKLFSIIVTFFITASVFAQSNINNYKYIIVSNKYDFLKEKDQYQLNSLTKFLFNKYGFEAVMEGSQYPQDLISNRCLALDSDVTKDPGMFKSKLKVELKDCNDKVVFTSKIGESREKDYKTAYNLALRDAFKSIQALNYKYKPNENLTSINRTSQTQVKREAVEEIQQLKKEIQNLKKKKTEVTSVEKPKVGTPKVVGNPKPKVVVQKPVLETKLDTINVLYAQAIDSGFRLVDNAPKVVYRIKNTNLKDVYLVEGKSAIIYKSGDLWFLEYYNENTKFIEKLNIKF